MADTPAKAEPAPSSAQQAIDGYRTTAKWIIGGFAAVGAAVAGTSVLGDLGQLSWSSDPGRLTVAAIAAAVGFVVVLVAIFTVADVLAPVTVTLPSLVENPPGQLDDLVKVDPSIGMSLKDFDQIYKALHDAEVNALKAVADSPTDDPALQRAAHSASNQFDALRDPVATIIDLGLVETVRDTFNNMRWRVGVCAIVAGLALTGFSWASNPPTPNTITTTKTKGSSSVSDSTTTASTTSTTTPSTTNP